MTSAPAGGKTPRAVPVLGACLVLLLPLVPLGTAVAAASADTWYAERFTAGETPVQVEHFWSKGARLRSETVIAGRKIVTIVNGERYTIIDDLAGTGVAIQRSAASIAGDAKRRRPFGNEAEQLIEAGAEKVGEHKIMGRACDLYRLTDRGGRRELCATSDEQRLPLEMKIWSRGSGSSAQVRYIDWATGIPIPDQFFQPDPRIELEYVPYEDYLKRARRELVGPAPPFYSDLLHGR